MVVPKVLRTEILNRLHDAKYAGKDLRQSKGWILLAMHDKRCFSLVSNLHFMSKTKTRSRVGQVAHATRTSEPSSRMYSIDSYPERKSIYNGRRGLFFKIDRRLSSPRPKRTNSSGHVSLRIHRSILKPTRIHTDQGREFESHLF